MGTLLRFNLKLLKARAGVNALVETGTGHGQSVIWALVAGFESLASVEQDAQTHQAAVANLRKAPHVQLQLGDSCEFLAAVPAASPVPRLFFLDAHFTGGADFKGHEAYFESARHARSFPLLEELDILRSKDVARDWIVIDDARLYVEGPFAEGECPAWARQWTQRPQLDARLAGFSATHDLHVLRQDHGYLVLVPKGQAQHLRDVVLVRPGDPPGKPLRVYPDVPGVTSISMQRRMADARFATRYFSGFGLDIGGGIDSLALFAEFFPLAKGITPYDVEQGDAQLLGNVDDDTFDFVYSSHCLEHLRDPAEALANWIRVTRPGGYLTVQVPDEDLYEQGKWPSRFNSDHKLTFTMHKRKSWSPVSVNVLDLLARFSDKAGIHSVMLLDQGFRYRMVGTGFDQTRTPLAECGIEFVLRKHTG